MIVERICPLNPPFPRSCTIAKISWKWMLARYHLIKNDRVMGIAPQGMMTSSRSPSACRTRIEFLLCKMRPAKISIPSTGG